MALFPRSFHYSDGSFAPLFRLLDDFEHYTRHFGGHHADARPMAWQPKFDFRETDEDYELHGELPGMKKENVHIEFTEPQTMLVRGKIEHTRSVGQPPSGQIEGTAMSGAITEGEESQKSPKAPSKASGEDEKRARSPQPKSETEVEKSAGNVKYWLSERSVGEFCRSFNFPSPVEQDSVNAKFRDGVLSIVVPKAHKRESRSIAISD